MNDKPKSVWTRPWQGWRKNLSGSPRWPSQFWILLGLGLASAESHNPAEHILPALGLALGISPDHGHRLVYPLAALLAEFQKIPLWPGLLDYIVRSLLCGGNFRGHRAWEKYRQAGEALGEKFDVASIAPPSVPDEQNFAMQPLWVEEISGMMGMEKAGTWHGEKVAALGHTNRVRPEMPIELYGQQLEQTNRTGNWQIAEKTDLAIWQTYYRHLATITNHFPCGARAAKSPQPMFCLALSKYDKAIQELRTISSLPHARFPVRYSDENPAMILLPHLASLKGCTTTLKLRALAELQSDQADQALADIADVTAKRCRSHRTLSDLSFGEHRHVEHPASAHLGGLGRSQVE